MAINSDVAQQKYNAPPTSPSSIGKQLKFYAIDRKSLEDAAEEAYFGQLGSTTNLPKHSGKAVKKFVYFPLIDDRNVNDQGIDAAGATIVNGNLYGSSRDTGTILDKMPTLTEVGGRVNRVGFHREIIEGSIEEFGFFYEFTDDSLNFDSDDQLMYHMRREAMIGANKLVEDHLQADILNGAGTILYTGEATSLETITGEAGGTISEATYEDFMRLDIMLTKNRTPKTIKAVTGSRLTDTMTIPSCRVMYIPTDLEIQLRTMKDPFGNPAFIESVKYAAAGNVLKGEIGSIGQFRLISIDEMQHDAHAGAEVTTNAGYRSSVDPSDSKEKYDVFPLLVVGGEDRYGAPFSHIRFNSTGREPNYTIHTQMTGADAVSHYDPYGKTGFSSIAWWYGILLERTERIAKIYTVAKI